MIEPSKTAKDLSTLGKRIRYSRSRLRISKAELARRVGVSSMAVGNWERKARHPRDEAMMRLISVLGVAQEFLLSGSNPPPEVAAMLSRKTSASAPQKSNDLAVAIDNVRQVFAKEIGVPVNSVTISLGVQNLS